MLEWEMQKKSTKLEKYGITLIGIFALICLGIRGFEYFTNKAIEREQTQKLVSAASTYELELQEEGILDENFKYTNSPKVQSFYKQVTAELNKSTPMEIGDGVQVIGAMKLPSISTYMYRLPITKKEFDAKNIQETMFTQTESLKSMFCNQVKKNIHFRVNNMREKYVYLDNKDIYITEINFQANQC